MPEFCNVPVIEYTTVCVGADVAEDVAEVVDFASDPLGYLAEQLQAASAGLTTTVLPAMEQLTHPDLTVSWFLGAYKVSFALSIFVFVALLGWNFIQLTRRRVSGDEVVETLAFYAPMFFAGVLFGPLLGNLLLSLTGALSDSLIQWGVGSTIGSTTTQLTTAITTGDPAQMAGGAIVAIAVYGVLLIALGLAFLTLLVMLVTLYLSGAVLPLSLVWIVNPRTRDRGMKVAGVWVGVCFSHVLLFLMLGIAFHLVTGQVSEAITDPGLRMVAQLATAAIALLMATLSPFALLAFAPVGPTSGGSGASMRMPSSSSSPGRGGRTVSDTDSQTAQLARSNETAEDETADGSGSGLAPSAGGLSTRLLESRNDPAGTSSTSMEPAGTGASGGPSSTSGEPAEAPAAAPSASGTGALAAAGNTTSDVGDKAAAAGTALEATGVGAPVGAALQGLAVVAKTAGSAASTTARLAESAGSMAAEHMDHANPRNKN